MKEYKALNGSVATIAGDTLTCVREGLVLTLPNVEVIYNKMVDLLLRMIFINCILFCMVYLLVTF